MRIQLSQSISLPLLNFTLRGPLLCVCGAESGGEREGSRVGLRSVGGLGMEMLEELAGLNGSREGIFRSIAFGVLLCRRSTGKNVSI